MITGHKPRESGGSFVASHERLSDFASSDGFKDCQQVKQLRQEIREIQDIGEKNGVPPSECLLMINRNYGLIWQNIPYHKMDELKQFIRNNAKYKMKILYPDFYNQLVAGGHAV